MFLCQIQIQLRIFLKSHYLEGSNHIHKQTSHYKFTKSHNAHPQDKHQSPGIWKFRLVREVRANTLNTPNR